MVRLRLQLFGMAKLISKAEANRIREENKKKAAVSTLKGVDQSVKDKISTTYQSSEDTLRAKDKMNDASDRYIDWASNTEFIDRDTMDIIKTPYVKSDSVLQAEKLLSSMGEELKSGKRTHTDALNNILNQFMNREKFEYDVDKDQLFQQSLASAMSSGKTAMQDAMGQAADLTGGYGSTYATSVGNQAYNSFIQDAYANLPEYYNMALAAYEAEGNEMLQQYSMLDAADSKEYAEMLDAYNRQYQTTRDMATDEFNIFNANLNSAFNSANLQLKEKEQIGNNLFNMYDIAYKEYESMYSKEYQAWADTINQYMKLAQIQNSDSWENTRLDYQKEQDKIKNDQWNQTFEYQKEQDKIAQSNLEKSYNLQRENARRENTSIREYTSPEFNHAVELYTTKGKAAAMEYIGVLAKQHGWLEDYAFAMLDAVSAGQTEGKIPLTEREWIMVSNGGPNGGGGIDKDGTVKYKYKDIDPKTNQIITIESKPYTLAELYDELQKTMSKKDAKDYILKLQKDLKIT